MTDSDEENNKAQSKIGSSTCQIFAVDKRRGAFQVGTWLVGARGLLR